METKRLGGLVTEAAFERADDVHVLNTGTASGFLRVRPCQFVIGVLARDIRREVFGKELIDLNSETCLRPEEVAEIRRSAAVAIVVNAAYGGFDCPIEFWLGNSFVRPTDAAQALNWIAQLAR